MEMTNTATPVIEPGRMTAGEAMARMLALHGVGPMYGMAGFQLLPLYEGIRQLGLEHHLVNDERTGAFAAHSYARATGRVGVCDATLGPGATNLVTGLVEAFNSGVPLVAIVGDAHREHAWKNMTQETRQVDILRPAVKELIRVEDPARIPESVRRAFIVATSGRPGPVVIDVPEDVMHAEHDYTAADFTIDPAAVAAPSRRSRPDSVAVASAAHLLQGAKRPLILAGGGVHLSDAHEALGALVAELDIPVAHTLSGKGAISCGDPRSVGLFGRYDRIANELIEKSDCLLVVGCKLGEIATKRYALPRPGTPLIHLDVVADEIGRWADTTVALCGDARSGLEDLLAELAPPPSGIRDAYWQEIAERRQAWIAEAQERCHSDERPINVARLMTEINAAMPADGFLIADGGFAAHWAGLLYDTKRAGRSFVADRGFASIGYGLPGSLGVDLARLGGPVVGLTGDGGMNMSLGDLETARRAGAGFTLVVINNAASGYIKALQHAMYGPEGYESSDLRELDYARLAEVMGCHGIRVEDPNDIGQALKEGMAERDVPTIIDVVVTRDPAYMLPAADSRTLTVEKGDRPV